MKKIFALICCLSLFFDAVLFANQNKEIDHVIMANLEGEEIEYFLLKPLGEGPFPVIFLLHGYQPSENSIGGKQLLDYGYLERFTKEGIAAVAISVPGYGNSKGKRDFGGPRSQKAIIALVDYFKNLPFIDSSKMGIYGISRGAQLAGMVSSHSSDISLQILESGFYDLISFSTLAPQYLERIKNGLAQEGGDSTDALVERSPLYHTQSTKAATLILQGEFDDRRQLPAAHSLHEKLINKGVESLLKVYPGQLHDLPIEKWETIIPFVRQKFLNLSGVGLKLSQATPAIQILKIHPDSSAFKSGKLKVGDAILGISPLNDDKEIDALRMPVDELIFLILGKKGTALRLHVQHFDLSFEDIIIQRE